MTSLLALGTRVWVLFFLSLGSLKAQELISIEKLLRNTQTDEQLARYRVPDIFKRFFGTSCFGPSEVDYTALFNFDLPYLQLYQTRFEGINEATQGKLTKPVDCGECACESLFCESIRGLSGWYGGCKTKDGQTRHCFTVDSPDPIYDHIRGRPLKLPIYRDPGMCRGDEDRLLDSLLATDCARCYNDIQYMVVTPKLLRSLGLRVPQVDLALSDSGHAIPGAHLMLRLVYRDLYPKLSNVLLKHWVILCVYMNQKRTQYIGTQVIYSPHPYYTELTKRIFCLEKNFDKEKWKPFNYAIPKDQNMIFVIMGYR